MDPKGACFIARRGHNASGSGTAHHHRTSAQLRTLTLFDGREERVEIEVQDRRRRQPVVTDTTSKLARLVPRTS